MTIEAAVYNNWSPCVGNPNLLYHRSFEGYCENITQGVVRVELWIGPCSTGSALGDGLLGGTQCPGLSSKKHLDPSPKDKQN